MAEQEQNKDLVQDTSIPERKSYISRMISSLFSRKSSKKDEAPYVIPELLPLSPTDPQATPYDSSQNNLENKVETPSQNLEERIESPVPVPEKKPEPPELGPYQATLDFLSGKFIRLHTLEKENESIRKDYNDSQDQIKKIEDEMLKTRGELESGKLEYVKKASEAEGLHSRLGKAEWALQQTGDQIHEFQKSQESHLASIDSLRSKITEYEKTMAGFRGVMAETDKDYLTKNSTLRSVIEEKDQQLGKYSQQIALYQRKEEELIQQLDVLKVAHAELQVKYDKSEDVHRQVTSLLKPKGQ